MTEQERIAEAVTERKISNLELELKLTREELQTIQQEHEKCQRILAVTLGTAEPTLSQSVQKVAKLFSDFRQNTLMMTEDRCKLKRRNDSLEAAVQAALVDLRIFKVTSETVRHYERILSNDFSWAEGSNGQS